jgi:hypothetical protein
MLSFHKEFKGIIALRALLSIYERWRSQSDHDKSIHLFPLHKRRNYPRNNRPPPSLLVVV